MAAPAAADAPPPDTGAQTQAATEPPAPASAMNGDSVASGIAVATSPPATATPPTGLATPGAGVAQPGPLAVVALIALPVLAAALGAWLYVRARRRR
jgi:hypothetical protein